MLTAPTRAERHALLLDIGHRAGAEFSRIVHLHGDECGRSIEHLLRAEGLTFARLATLPPVSWPGSDSVLVIVDEAELVPQVTLAALATLCDSATGAAVQVVLAGSPALIPMLCQPECHAIWREIRMTLMLEKPAPGARFSGPDGLMAGAVRRRDHATYVKNCKAPPHRLH
ncbi:ATP-binding protein [Croceicoccus naphthovorans]|uniref:ATP-binding protein n=1 Tax=Croceicoccus naphthovorans TaxID=1348774 RepID=UPI001C54F4C2|nr:ATP-binding protein [Croceicoccus naphthovorans]